MLARPLDAVNANSSRHVVGKMTRPLPPNPSRSGARRGFPRVVLAVLSALLGWAVLVPSSARADDDRVPRVGRVADVGGELFLASQDAPEQWTAIGLNYPVGAGDNLWAGSESRAEIDVGGAQLRLAGDTSLHISRLDDRNFTLYVAQGRVILRVRMLEPGESARVDTPNGQLELTRPGLYRIDVLPGQQRTELAVREGEAVVATGTAAQQVLPGQSATLDGAAPQFAQVRNGIATDGFDVWSADRDRRYDRVRANGPVSRQMVGAADLDDYGAWETTPNYGAVWYPASVPADWAPYSTGYWTDVGAWGMTWVDAAPWGYAPFHYGRWARIQGRWGWCPGGYVQRPVWAPALVGWVGGPGWRYSGMQGGPVYGWVPLGWGEAYHPRWKGCSEICWTRYNRPYAVTGSQPDAPPRSYVNATTPGAITAVKGPAIIGRKPVQSHRVAIPVGALAGAPVLAEPMIRPDVRQGAGIKPGKGLPPAASVTYAAPGRPPRAVVPVNAPSTPVAPAPVAKPLPSTPAQQVSTHTQPPARVQAVPQPASQPVNQAPVRMHAPQLPAPQATIPPVVPPISVSPPAAQGGNAPPRATTLPQREQRTVPTLPVAPVVVAPVVVAPAASAPAAHPGVPIPVPHTAPVAAPAGTPAAQHTETPKADKPAAPVSRAPGDVPAK